MFLIYWIPEKCICVLVQLITFVHDLRLRVKESVNSFVQSPDSLPAAKEIATSPENSSTPVLGPRTRKPPVRWAEESTTSIYAGLALDPDEIVKQQTYEDAIASPQQSAERKLAMEYEMDSLIKN
jgi:hypothetical protein